MLEIGEYHDNIVNLQGISYSIDEDKRSLIMNVIVLSMLLFASLAAFLTILARLRGNVYRKKFAQVILKKDQD